MKCHCGKELSQEELNNDFNKPYKHKMCLDCMYDYCEHAITGE